MIRVGLRGRLLRLVLAAILMVPAVPSPASGIAPDGIFVSAPNRKDIVFDDARRLLYISAGNQVLRYNVDSRSFLEPWTVPSADFMGMDLSPDGSTLAVADAAVVTVPNAVHLIDVQAGVMETVTFDPATEWGAYSVAYGADGRLLVTTRYPGSGWVPLRRYDPATKTAVTLCTVRQNTMLCASMDGSLIAWAESNISSGPIGRYRVADGSLVRTDAGGFNYEITVNANGSRVLVPKNYVAQDRDGNLTPLRELAAPEMGATFLGETNIVLVTTPETQEIRAFDLDTRRLVGSRNVGHTFDWQWGHAFVEGRIKASADGRLVFATVDDGVWIGSTDFAAGNEGIPGRPMPASPVGETWGVGGSLRTVRAVQLKAGERFDATLAVPVGADLDLALYPPSKTSMSDAVDAVATSRSQGDGVDESLGYTAPVSATYYLATTCVAGGGASVLDYTITPGGSAGPDDDIPGIPMVGSATGSLGADSDTWDVYSVRVPRRGSFQVTVTADPGLDADVHLFVGDGNHVVFYEPDASSANAVRGGVESLTHVASTDATCYVAVKAREGAGSYVLESATFAPPALATTLALTASQSAGGPAQVSGRLLDEESNPVSWATVVVESSPDGSTWVPVSNTYSRADGEYSASVPMSRNQQFRAVYSGAQGAYLPTVSDAVEVTFTPSVTWLVGPPSLGIPGQTMSLKVASVLPVLNGTPLVGNFRFTRMFSAEAVETTVQAVGVFDPVTGATDFAAMAVMPPQGVWQVTFELPGGDSYGPAVSDIRFVGVGATTLSIAVSKATLAAGESLTITGYLKEASNSKGITGKRVYLETSLDDNDWKRSTTSLKTGTGGKVTFTIHPKYCRYYRLVFDGDESRSAVITETKRVQTLFTLSGSPGHFKTKRFLMSYGQRKVRLTIKGSAQSVWIHSADETIKLKLAKGTGTYTGYIDVYSPTWCHIYVSGSGSFKIQVWN